MHVIDLGLTDFSEVYRFQLELVNKVSQGLREDTLIITEHRPVITIGRKGSSANVLRSFEFLRSRGIDVLETDRGGDVTYHGPGQIVCYPIFKLDKEARGIHGFLDFLEEAGLYFLGQYGITAKKKHALRGLWFEDKKIASIGIGVKKWVTYHGIAININIDLTPFSYIRPCGIEGVRMTSLNKVLEREADIDDAKAKLGFAFKEVSSLVEAVSKS